MGRDSLCLDHPHFFLRHEARYGEGLQICFQTFNHQTGLQGNIQIRLIRVENMRSVQVSEPKGPLEVVERDIPEPGYDKEPSEEHDYYKDC